MNTQLISDLIARALSTLDDHDKFTNRALFFSILSQVMEEGLGDVDMAEGYAEPGYDVSDTESPSVLLANWNSETRWDRETNKSEVISNLMPRLCEFAEAVDCSIEWSDEWTICECRKTFRISPDSHGWKMYGAFIEDMSVCGDCIIEDPSEYFDTISGDPRMAITIAGLNPLDYGFVKINDDSFEYGLHGGQNSSSDAIARTLKSSGVHDFLFSVDSAGQFDLRFSVFVSEEYEQAARHALSKGDTSCDIDPATALSQGLKAAGDAMAKLQEDGGIKVASVDLGDGTATARSVSAAEFVSGVKS
jgi:hypothetical protein